MTKRGLSLLLDTTMLAAFATLMSWRFTGVPIHEWLAVGLLVVIATHLLIHWDWIASRLGQIGRGGAARTRVNVALNGGLFVTMGTALASGFFMSKVIVPNRLTPGAYLKWHGIHEQSANLALVILGLHVALNWDLIAGGIRRFFRRGGATAPTAAGRPAAAVVLRPLLWIVLAGALLTIGTRAAGALLPDVDRIMMIGPDGRREVRAPPPEITAIRPGTDAPMPNGGAARFVLRFAVLGAVAAIGRKVLRLRLA